MDQALKRTVVSEALHSLTLPSIRVKILILHSGRHPSPGFLQCWLYPWLQHVIYARPMRASWCLSWVLSSFFHLFNLTLGSWCWLNVTRCWSEMWQLSLLLHYCCPTCLYVPSGDASSLRGVYPLLSTLARMTLAATRLAALLGTSESWFQQGA